MLTQKVIGGDKVYQGAKGAILLGRFGNTAGFGIGVNSTRTGVLKVHADDQGIIKTTGTFRAMQGRMLLTAINTGGTFCGVQGQIKQIAAATGAAYDFAAGVWGYVETVGTQTAKNLFGVRATVDCPSGTTIASGGIVGGLLIDSIYMGGTHTGKAVCIKVGTPNDGAWDYFIDSAAQAGVFVANTHSIDSHALVALIPVRMGSTDGFIPCFGAAPA